MEGTELCQVAFSSPLDRRVPGGLEQPKRIHYADEDQPHSSERRPVELGQAPNGVLSQGRNFLNVSNSRQEDGVDLYAHNFEPQSHRRFEKVLPSIERDLLDEHSDQTSLHGKMRQVKPLGSYSPLIRGMQQLPARAIINLDDYEELPISKRRRTDVQQPSNFHSQAKTILVPIEQMDDRRPRHEQSREAAYRDDNGHSILDKRIVPLPPKEDRAKSSISHQELQLLSPRKQLIPIRLDSVADRVEWYPQSRDHRQVPLSRSENVEDLQFPSRTVFAPSEYSNDSPSFLDSSHFAPRLHESSDMGSPSRHEVGFVANSDRVYADSNGNTRPLQPSEVVDKSMPSRFSDMSMAHRQRDNDRRTDHGTYLPFTATADLYRNPEPSTGALAYFFTAATAIVRG